MKVGAARRVAPDSPVPFPPPALAFSIAALPSLLALFFWPSLQSAFLAPKSALLACAAALLGAAMVLTRTPFPQAPTFHQRLFLWGIVVFVGLALLSALVSPRKDLSLQSLIFFIAGAALLPIASAGLRGRPEWLLRGIASAGISTSLFAIANRFGVDAFAIFGLHSNYSAGRMQIASTLGNPNFVASFLASTTAATLFLSLQKSSRAWIWRVGLALSVVALWLTQSRVGIVALFLALVLPLLFQRTTTARSLAAAFILLFAVTGYFVNRDNPRTFRTASTGRSVIWQVAVQDGIRPLGDGPGTFAYLYPARLGRWFAAHPDPALLRFTDNQTHAHNDFLEFFTETGSLGGAAFLATIALGIFGIATRLRSSTFAPFAVAGISALLTTALFDFPLHRAEAWALLWLWMSFPFLESPAASAGPATNSFRFAALLAIPVAAISVFPAIASYHVHQGLAFEAQSSDPAAAREYQKAIALDATNPDAQFYLARAMANAGDSNRAYLQTQIAEHWVDEPDLYVLRARILVQMSKRNLALAILQQAHKRFPHSEELTKTEVELQAMTEK